MLLHGDTLNAAERHEAFTVSGNAAISASRIVTSVKMVSPPVPDPPCDGCRHWDVCRNGLACDRFSHWTNSGRNDPAYPDRPDAWNFYRLFGGPAVKRSIPANPRKIVNPNAKPVVNLQTGEVFDSIGAAAKAAGVPRGSLRRKMSGKRSLSVPGRWAYLQRPASGTAG